jgi:hypothetical protein
LNKEINILLKINKIARGTQQRDTTKGQNQRDRTKGTGTPTQHKCETYINITNNQYKQKETTHITMKTTKNNDDEDQEEI